MKRVSLHLAKIGGEGHDLAVIGVLQPLEDHGGIEATRVGQNALLDLGPSAGGADGLQQWKGRKIGCAKAAGTQDTGTRIGLGAPFQDNDLELPKYPYLDGAAGGNGPGGRDTDLGPRKGLGEDCAQSRGVGQDHQAIFLLGDLAINKPYHLPSRSSPIMEEGGRALGLTSPQGRNSASTCSITRN